MNLIGDIHKRDHSQMPAGEGGAPLIQYRWEFGQLYKEVQMLSWSLASVTAGMNSKFNILEIGSERGGSLWYWIDIVNKNAGGGNVVSVDLPNGLYDIDYSVWDTWVRADDVTLTKFQVDSSTSGLREKLWEVNDFDQYNFIFIDGSHLYNGVKNDFLMAQDLIGYKGIIALHDIMPHAKAGGSEVHRLWKEIQEAGYRTRVLQSMPNQDERGIGCVYL